MKSEQDWIASIKTALAQATQGQGRPVEEILDELDAELDREDPRR